MQPTSYLSIVFCFFHFAISATCFGQERIGPEHTENMRKGLDLFKKRVRATLIENCLKCHQSKSAKGDFDLSNRKALLESGFVSESTDSYLVQLIKHEEEPFMPHKAQKLPQGKISEIEKWIELGAPYDKPLAESTQREGGPRNVTKEDREFWSFQPLAKNNVPPLEKGDWYRNDIDRFVLTKLNSHGLHANPQADRRILMRRAYFDLIGLPPTPAEIESFVKDPDPDAYEEMIERLLDSRHYGERWARHWMDIARFAESSGFEHDDDRPNAFHYRDFLIKALNEDLPYDTFVRWQIAGDEMAPQNPIAVAATGFLGAGVFPTQLTEVEFESARYDELDDMVSTTGLAFLGLSIGCARCHDHKFDPIPARDYYSLVATFAQTVRGQTKISLEPSSPPVAVQVSGEGFKPIKNHGEGRGYPYFYKDVYFLQRGDVSQKKEIMQPNILQVLAPQDAGFEQWQRQPPGHWKRSDFRRTALANWLTDPQYGAGQLAARVIVNRLWKHHFGRGIVATPNDFGMQGERPTHPALLDWLAADLIQGGWKLKRLHKLIMTSATYMQNDSMDAARSKIDPKNYLLWRRTPRRLEAEPIRDALLAVSGMLDRRMYGKGTLDESSPRRSIYFTVKRTKLIPSMMLFDWPEHLVSIGERATTTTAPQALSFMNSPQVRQYAIGLAKQIHPLVSGDTKKNEKRDFDRAIQRGFQTAFGRDATPVDIELANGLLKLQLPLYKSGNAEIEALADLCQMLVSSNEFIFIR